MVPAVNPPAADRSPLNLIVLDPVFSGNAFETTPDDAKVPTNLDFQMINGDPETQESESFNFARMIYRGLLVAIFSAFSGINRDFEFNSISWPTILLPGSLKSRISEFSMTVS